MPKAQQHSPLKARPARTLETLTAKQFIADYIYRIDLDADYQREKIWSREDQEMLIDSMMQNIDIPKLYLVEVRDNETFDFECIDGKQRMATLLAFFKPDSDTHGLTVRIAGERYSYGRLQVEFPSIAKKIEDYELTFVIYKNLDEQLLREIFRRLQLGIRLNSGELLKTYTGTIRDFVYREMGSNAPFLRNTRLSLKRFSRQFTLAQVCINSFSLAADGEFVRARYDDLGDFFKDKYDLEVNDPNLVRIRSVLNLMDKHFGTEAVKVSSRAVAVSAYLYVEDLFLKKQSGIIGQFATFYGLLLDEVKHNLGLLAKYQNPDNSLILEQFQKYVSQASVESYAIKRRHGFLEKAFAYYRSPKGKGKVMR
ncbi:MAG TPA: DUF262 domain-containing protein [Verrucomicrobiae bacterium]|nr:DUF262 domain-containing protein [Verrucomicrobiae bacterium]